MIAELDTKLEVLNILPGSWVTITSSGSDVTINASWWGWIAPFLETNPVLLGSLENEILILQWVYFTPTTSVSIPWFGGTINSTTIVDPNTIQLDVTSWTTIGDFDIVLDNSGILNTVWPNNGVDYITVVAGNVVKGTGSAWILTTDFETGLWSWSDGGGQQSWTLDSWGTPSGGTWPLAWSGSVFYVYTETSTNGVGFPNRTFILQTTDFRVAQSITFDYHAFGATTGNLELQTLFNGVWTTRFTLSWQQQTTQGAAYLNQVVDLSTFSVEGIRFFYTSGNNFTWDMALDNVIIESF